LPRLLTMTIMMVIAFLLAACTSAAPSTPVAPAKPAESPASKPAVVASPVSAPAAAIPVASPSPVTASQGSGLASAVSGEITIFAASSLTDAFNEIGAQFQAANPGSKVTFNYGASSQLRTQLEQGARADIFASANQQEMDKAKQSRVISGTERVFVRNRLAVITPKDNPGAITSLKDLAKPGLKFVTAAPEVPIGVYTQDVLEKLAGDPAYGADFKDRVNANIVSREPNVRQVVAKVNLGEADAAVVYTSDVAPDVRNTVSMLEIPDQFNTLATYPIAVIKDALNPTGGAAFSAYVLSLDGQASLKKWGFLTAS
jgi:molybdate transport system substrate-binding protein